MQHILFKRCATNFTSVILKLEEEEAEEAEDDDDEKEEDKQHLTMAVCVAVIGKENSPKYISCLNSDMELQFHYKIHTSLDVVEEKLSSIGKNSGDVRELYLGLLYCTEEHKIFGYVTNTKIKLIIAVESSNTLLRDNEVRTMFRRLHSLYTDVVCNPFYIPGDLIISKNFDIAVKSIMTGNA